MRGADERRRGSEPEIDRIATGVRGSGGLQEGGNASSGRMGTLNGAHLTGSSDAVCVHQYVATVLYWEVFRNADNRKNSRL